MSSQSGEPSPDAVRDSVGLAAGPLAATIQGGDLLSVRGLSWQGVELLEDPAALPPGYRVHGDRAGITLLHPWANRLAADSFSFQGITAQLPADSPRVSRDGAGLAIHGLRAPSSWRLRQEGTAGVRASLTWLGEPGFPFPHALAVHFRLESGADPDRARLRIRTVIHALGRREVPVSVGWHPYFRVSGPAEITVAAADWLAADDRGLPTGARTHRPVAHLDPATQALDDGLAGLGDGTEMSLALTRRTLAVRFISGYDHGQVFAPPDAAVVSLEPMSAPTNALGSGAPLPVATRGRPHVGEFCVEVTQTDPGPPGPGPS